MTEDKTQTRLAATDPWDVVADARRDRGPVVAVGARTAVAWLYQGQAVSRTGAAMDEAMQVPARSWLRRLTGGSLAAG